MYYLGCKGITIYIITLKVLFLGENVMTWLLLNLVNVFSADAKINLIATYEFETFMYLPLIFMRRISLFKNQSFY